MDKRNRKSVFQNLGICKVNSIVLAGLILLCFLGQFAFGRTGIGAGGMGTPRLIIAEFQNEYPHVHVVTTPRRLIFPKNWLTQDGTSIHVHVSTRPNEGLSLHDLISGSLSANDIPQWNGTDWIPLAIATTYLKLDCSNDPLTNDLDITGDLFLSDFDSGAKGIADILNNTVNKGVLDVITITDEGGLNITWSAGVLWDTVSGATIEIDANATPTACTTDVINYLWWDRSGGGTTLTLGTTRPDFTDNDILVGLIVCQSNDIWGIHTVNILNKRESDVSVAVRDVLNCVVTEGLIVSEDADATNPFDVEISAGTYYHFGVEMHNLAASFNTRTTAMTRWYHTGGAWDNDTDAEIDMDEGTAGINRYDNLTNRVDGTAAKYYKSLFMYSDNLIHWIYPQAEYDTLAQALAAPLPTIPPVGNHYPRSVAVVMKGNDAAFPTAAGNRWIDIRPIFGNSVLGTIVDHGSLVGLGDDDHTIYYLADGTRAMVSCQLTDADASPNAIGELLYDNTVAGFTDGLFAWYDDDEIRYLVDIATLPGDAQDDYVVAYDKDLSGFYMKTAGAGTDDQTLAEVLASGADANDLDITSMAQLQGVDVNTYIDMDTTDIITTKGNLIPSANGADDLGTDALEYMNAWFDGTMEADTITEGGVAVINATQGGAWTGTHDFGGATLEVPQTAGDLTLSATSNLAIDTTQKQLGWFDGTREVVIPSDKKITALVTAGQWDLDSDMWLWELDGTIFPDGIVITKWSVDGSVAAPAVELNANLMYCDALSNGAFPGGGATLIDVLDTTTGNSSEADMSNSDLTTGAIATTKILYIDIDVDPATSTEFYVVQIYFYIPES